ncbi:hepatic triacylglycerol lipase [Electrophorus electricus]|uniref:hepatic triacylglycerol lipase n=1 Tax=Electrophorus electricus TaxID=8005 RepID=UPI0015CFADE3|nr:hepatic triacylglycerol lipase [Electrophorus electricus]
MKSSVRVFFFLLLIFAFSKAVKAEGNVKAPDGRLQQGNEVTVPLVVKSTFHMHLQGNTFEDTCTIVPFHSETLSTCNYNSSSPLVIIIHGWTINGKMEEWMFRMASALKARLGHMNVLISDWRPLALQPYQNAAKNSRHVGSDVARLVSWLEETTQLSMDKVHLIGYSLGAHVAGFAGSHFTGERKLGRITGLDPAGPQFEGVPASDRLSPDDAKFVDTIHTFSKSSIGFTLGIRQLVGHVDFYPNGGSFQPGCQMTDMYNNLYQFGLEGLPKTVKCTHQRAVHLFTDSILNMDQQMTAYRCRDDGAFDKGLCLDCKKNRCNILGYNVRRVFKRGNNKGLYLKTGSQTPFKVYHYQIKVLLKNLTASVQVSVSISLIGTKGQSEYLPVTLSQEHAENKTYSALAAVGLDMGDLQAVRLHWEGEAAWTSWWRRVSSIMSGGSRRHDTELSMWRIRLKSGESQEKIWFCGKTGDTTHFKPSQEQEFIRCKDISKKMINVTKPQDQESGKA